MGFGYLGIRRHHYSRRVGLVTLKNSSDSCTKNIFLYKKWRKKNVHIFHNFPRALNERKKGMKRRRRGLGFTNPQILFSFMHQQVHRMGTLLLYVTYFTKLSIQRSLRLTRTRYIFRKNLCMRPHFFFTQLSIAQ